jgi:PAS domain S-box-containing protein
MPSTRLTLSHLLLGQKGGEHRAQIIEMLRERPYNLNQMAELLGVNYRTVKHHIDVLIDNDLVGPPGPHGYGQVFYLTPVMEENLPLFDTLMKKVRDLTASPTFFRSVIESTSDAVAIIDGSGEVIFWNESAERMFGHPADAVIGQRIPIFPEEGFLEGVIRRVLGGEKVYAQEARGRRRDGTDLDLAITVDVLEDAEGDVEAYIIFARDIGDRIRQRREREHLASFPVLNPNPVLELDASGRVVFHNESATRTLHRLGLGEDPRALLPPDIDAILARLARGEPGALRREVRAADATFDLSIGIVPEFKVVRIYAIDITELRQRERETLMANERLAHLLSNSPAVVYTSKTSGDFAATFISDNVERLTGYRPGAFLEEPGFWGDHIHPDDVERVMAGATLALEKGTHSYEYRFRRADGRYIWVYDEFALVRDASGAPVELVGYWADITDRRTYQEGLRLSEERRHLAFSSTGMGTFIRDIRTGKVEFGKELEAIYGLPPGGLGASFEAWERTLHPDDLGPTRATIARNRTDPHPAPMEFRVVWPDGSVHWVRSWSETLPGEDGKPELVVGVNMDITEQKRSERALAASEERYRYLFETTTQGIVVQGADGLITSANPQALRLLGLSLDQMQGRTSMDPRWRPIKEDGSDFPGNEHPAMVALGTGATVRDVLMGVFNPAENDYVWISIDAVPRFRQGEARPFEAFTTFKRVQPPERGARGPSRHRPPQKLAPE